MINGVDYLTSRNLVSLELGFKNNLRLDSGFYPGSGTQHGAAIRGRLEFGDREASLKFVARFEHGSTELTKLKNQTTGTAVISLQGEPISGSDYHSLEVTFHKVAFRTAVVGDTDGIVTVEVECHPLRVPGVTTAHVLRMPSAKDAIVYRRGFARILDLPFNRQELTVNLAAAGALYQRLVQATEGYAGAVPIIHQAVAVKAAMPGQLLRRALDLRSALKLGVKLSLDEIAADDSQAMLTVEEEQAHWQQERAEANRR